MNSLNYNLEIIGENTNYTPRKEIIDPIVNSDKKIFEITAPQLQTVEIAQAVMPDGSIIAIEFFLL